nr:PAS domain-containing protein [Microvirga tunisiensis]
MAPVPTTISTADDHRLIEVNEAFTKILGFRAQDVVGYAADDIGLWADDRDRRRFEAELTKANTVRDFEARLWAKGGEELECLVAAEAIMLSDRACILCSFQDITARRRSEEELVKAIEAVMADASRFSRDVVEKLAALRHPSQPGQSSAQPLGRLGAGARHRGRGCRRQALEGVKKWCSKTGSGSAEQPLEKLMNVNDLNGLAAVIRRFA